MNTSSPKPRNRFLSIISSSAFTLVSLLFLAILLDSMLRTELRFNWFNWLVFTPLILLAITAGLYALHKSIKLPPDQLPLSLGRRVILVLLFMLFLALPVGGIWSVISEVAACREVRANGNEIVARLDYAKLEYRTTRGVRTQVSTPEEANQLNTRLRFTVEGTAIDYSPSVYLPDTAAIAKVWDEAQTGTLRVRYLPGDPKTFFVAAAPCRESAFAMFLGN